MFLPEEFQHSSAGISKRDLLHQTALLVAKWLQDIRAGQSGKQSWSFSFFAKIASCVISCAEVQSQFDNTGKPARFIGTAQDITERKLAEIQIRQQIERLTALRKIDQAISSSFDLNVTLDILLSQVISQLQVDAADVLLLSPDEQTLTYAAGEGFRTNAIESARLRMADSQAARERRSIHVENLENEPDDRLLTPLGSQRKFCLLLWRAPTCEGEVKGVLEVFHRARLEPDPEWLGFLEALAGQAAIAIDNATLFDDLQRCNLELGLAYDATIEGWSHALDLRDKETEGHTQRVTEMTLSWHGHWDCRRAIGAHAPRRAAARYWQDGRARPYPAQAGSADRRRMGHHAAASRLRLRDAGAHRLPAPALDIPYCHHEQWDGTGYPRGLKGEEIPLAARLFAVVDVWDALRSDRPYRAAWPIDKALDHIRSLSAHILTRRQLKVFSTL